MGSSSYGGRQRRGAPRGACQGAWLACGLRFGVCVGAPWAFSERRAGGWGAAVVPVRSAVV